jgi:hypothetical protein
MWIIAMAPLPIDSLQPVQVLIPRRVSKKRLASARIGVDRRAARLFISFILKHAM